LTRRLADEPATGAVRVRFEEDAYGHRAALTWDRTDCSAPSPLGASLSGQNRKELAIPGVSVDQDRCLPRTNHIVSDAAMYGRLRNICVPVDATAKAYPHDLESGCIAAAPRHWRFRPATEVPATCCHR
jgi:hypothetical protein